MTILKVAGNVALVAVMMILLGGCCQDQERTIGILKIDNSELRKMLIDEQRQSERMDERIRSHENDARKLGDLIVSRDQTIQALKDQVTMLQAAKEKRDAEYQRLVEQLAAMGAPARSGLPKETSQLLKALVSTYPGMLEFDEATGRLRFSSDLTFEKGKADVNAQGTEALGRLANILSQEQAKPVRVDVVGHTCTTPIVKPETKALFPTNQVLSEKRAKAVANILTAGGVASTRIATRGMGSTQLLVPSQPKSAGNRRVEVFLSMP